MISTLKQSTVFNKMKKYESIERSHDDDGVAGEDSSRTYSTNWRLRCLQLQYSNAWSVMERKQVQYGLLVKMTIKVKN